MTHDELKDALSALALGALDSAERDVVEAHVRGCAECQAELAVLTRVVDGIGLEANPVTPPPALKSKVMARVAAQASSTSPEAKPLDMRRFERPKPAPSALRWVLPLAVAASLMIAATALFYAFTLRGEIAKYESFVQVIQSPDVLSVTLKGQATASNATGRAFWSRTKGMVFAAQQLPPLPAGRVYQLWTITGTTATSAGLMTPDARGSASVILTVAANAPKPDAFGVTIEPAGGSQSPTLPIVLLGAAGQ